MSKLDVLLICRLIKFVFNIPHCNRITGVEGSFDQGRNDKKVMEGYSFILILKSKVPTVWISRLSDQDFEFQTQKFPALFKFSLKRKGFFN